MPEHYIENIARYKDEIVTLKGWVYNLTKKGKLIFILLRDGTGIIQCTLFKPEITPEIFESAKKLTQESSIEISGKVREDKRAPGGYELSVTGLKIIQISPEYPIQPKEHGVDFLLNHRHLWLRSKKQHAILRIRAAIIKAMCDFLDNEGFVRMDSPIFTPSACEGTTNLFEVKYFEDKAYLSQSGQLYAEASAMAFSKVYCFGPTFRAEKSKTRRHLTEFWMLEPEMAFYTFEDNLKLQENFVSYIVEYVLKTRKTELETLKRNTDTLKKVKPPFPRITYTEAIKLLNKNGFKKEWGEDLGAEEETFLANRFEKPFFITYFPIKCKAFYMLTDTENPELAVCADMLAPEGYGEIIGGSQREHDYQKLLERIKEHNLPVSAFNWYLDLRKYGSVPHGGFGIGIERTVAWICGIKHVRETIPFPRMLYRLNP